MADSSFKEEQARKARALAEKCFVAGNVPGARRWMQSASRLAPNLPGTAQAAAAYDVHAAAARRPVDWYAVLGLARPRPTWTGAVVLAHGDIKRRHRKLCLLVHPDKNPSAAADGAFKLVHAAWETLSARHPPAADDATTNAAAAPAQPARRPPEPPPQPRQRRPPTKPRGPHQERRGNAARAPQAARRPAAASPNPGCCPKCGALTPYGKRSLRCMVCHWSPTDRWHDDDDGDYFE